MKVFKFRDIVTQPSVEQIWIPLYADWMYSHEGCMSFFPSMKINPSSTILLPMREWLRLVSGGM